jgi:hypothetical protein
MTMRRQALRSRKPLVTVSFLSLILSLFFALPSLLANAQDAQPDKVAYAQPGDMNTGALLLQSGEDGYVEAPRLHTDAAITVSGTIARVVLTQRFQNPSDRSLKAPGAFDQRLVVFALLLILSAVTLVMWRYHRRDYASPRRTGRRI